MAGTGAAKNIVPMREKARSKPDPRSSDCASATWKRTFSTPSWRASSIDASMNLGEASMPTASPPGPTIPASRWVVSPKPHPTSRTRSPGCGSARRIAASPCAPRPVVTRWRKRAKRSNSGPSHASIASAFGSAAHRACALVIGRSSSARERDHHTPGAARARAAQRRTVILPGERRGAVPGRVDRDDAEPVAARLQRTCADLQHAAPLAALKLRRTVRGFARRSTAVNVRVTRARSESVSRTRPPLRAVSDGRSRRPLMTGRVGPPVAACAARLRGPAARWTGARRGRRRLVLVGAEVAAGDAVAVAVHLARGSGEVDGLAGRGDAGVGGVDRR